MSTKATIFRDQQLQDEFDKNGFVKFRMFSEEQIGRIRDYYMQTQEAHETIADQRKFHATNETNNPELISSSDNMIRKIMMEEVDKHFIDYKIIAANYLVKQSDQQSELGPHQDLRFVDETRFYSFNIWVATEPTRKENGGLRFVAGSHLWHDTVRTLPSYPWKYKTVFDDLLSMLTDVTTEVGDVVILNHACIHASYPNLSGRIRIAAIMAMIPQEAEITHYFLPEGDPQNEVEEYVMTLQDFVYLKVGQRPENARLNKKFIYDFSPVDAAYLRKEKGVEESQENHNLYEQFKQRLSAIFGIAR
jgi:ectoine hydroxylase-related dioxygenase (phytanoyl-CoA dioxygenase family)